jgi:hypothetical protein
MVVSTEQKVRYSFRPYFLPDNKLLLKQTISVDGEPYSLVTKEDGEHQERHVRLSYDVRELVQLIRAIFAARRGQL